MVWTPADAFFAVNNAHRFTCSFWFNGEENAKPTYESICSSVSSCIHIFSACKERERDRERETKGEMHIITLTIPSRFFLSNDGFECLSTLVFLLFRSLHASLSSWSWIHTVRISSVYLHSNYTHTHTVIWTFRPTFLDAETVEYCCFYCCYFYWSYKVKKKERERESNCLVGFAFLLLTFF